MIYLDYNATTPVDPRVLERMLPYFSERFGNASSAGHAYGWAAAEAVEQAREEVAALVGAGDESEVTFTSGATEGLTLALKGVVEAYARKGRHVVTASTEHRAVLDATKAMQYQDVETTYLDVGADGRLEPGAFADALHEDTVLAAVMQANNETGVLQPIAELYEIARAQNVLLLVDATQAAGKVPVEAQHADLLVLSAHKFYGPKGVGALWTRRRGPRVRLVPQQEGGGQERGRRGGTLNTPGIVGMGEAARLAREEREADAERLAKLRDCLEREVLAAVPAAYVNGAEAPRLPQTSSLTFPGIEASKLLVEARELALATGSACSSASGKPSHVLTAMGCTPEEARSTVRVSLGRPTAEEDVDTAVAELIRAVEAVAAARPATRNSELETRN